MTLICKLPSNQAYSKVGFRRTQGLEPQPVGFLIFQNLAFLFLFHPPDEQYVRNFEETSARNETHDIRRNLRIGGRKRNTVHMRTSSSKQCRSRNTGNWSCCTCIHALMKIVPYPKIPAWHVLKFGAFSSLLVLGKVFFETRSDCSIT